MVRDFRGIGIGRSVLNRADQAALREAQAIYGSLGDAIGQWLAEHPKMKVHVRKMDDDPFEPFSIGFIVTPENPKAADVVIVMEGHDLSLSIAGILILHEVPYRDDIVRPALDAISIGRIRSYESPDFKIVEVYQQDRTLRRFERKSTLRGLFRLFRSEKKAPLPHCARTYEAW